MKIAVFNGSPKLQNTAALVDAFCEGAKEAGHEVRDFAKSLQEKSLGAEAYLLTYVLSTQTLIIRYEEEVIMMYEATDY